MIAVDTSALMAILLDETPASACAAALEAEDEILISAGTAAEALIVAARHDFGDEMERLIGGLGLEIVSVDARLGAARGASLWPLGQGHAPGASELWRLLRLRGGQGARLPTPVRRR